MTSMSEIDRGALQAAEIMGTCAYFTPAIVVGLWNPATTVWAITGMGVHLVVNISSQALGLRKTTLGKIATHITSIALALFAQAAAMTSLLGIPFSASLLISLHLAGTALGIVASLALLIGSLACLITMATTPRYSFI